MILRGSLSLSLSRFVFWLGWVFILQTCFILLFPVFGVLGGSFIYHIHRFHHLWILTGVHCPFPSSNSFMTLSLSISSIPSLGYIKIRHLVPLVGARVSKCSFNSIKSKSLFWSSSPFFLNMSILCFLSQKKSFLFFDISFGFIWLWHTFQKYSQRCSTDSANRDLFYQGWRILLHSGKTPQLQNRHPTQSLLIYSSFEYTFQRWWF